REGSFPGGRYSIEGERCPLLHIELREVKVYFDPHALFWKEPTVHLMPRPGGGFWQQIFSGAPRVVLEAQGPGSLGLRGEEGWTLALPLAARASLEVRGRHFLASTSALHCTSRVTPGAANVLFGGSALLLDTFEASQDGVLFLHGRGDLFEVRLAENEQ